MSKSLREIYVFHHDKERPENFSVMENERSILLKKEIGIGKKVLDIGCRDGILTKHFVEGNEVLGIDIDDESLATAAKNLGIETKSMDLNGNWQELGNRKFDIIVAGEVIEHLYYPVKVIEKIIKHLNEHGGVLVGSVPNAFSIMYKIRYLKSSKRFTPLDDPTHINHFSYGELKKLLENYFKEVRIIGLGRYAYLSKKFPSLFAFDLFFVAKK